MQVSGDRQYYFKCIDRLLGLAESSKLPVKGYAFVEKVSSDSNESHCFAYVQFQFGTETDTVMAFKTQAQKCFRNMHLTIGTTGNDKEHKMYRSIFMEYIPQRRNIRRR